MVLRCVLACPWPADAVAGTAGVVFHGARRTSIAMHVGPRAQTHPSCARPTMLDPARHGAAPCGRRSSRRLTTQRRGATGRSAGLRSRYLHFAWSARPGTQRRLCPRGHRPPVQAQRRLVLPDVPTARIHLVRRSVNIGQRHQEHVAQHCFLRIQGEVSRPGPLPSAADNQHPTNLANVTYYYSLRFNMS
jgi:hypothetical protein